MLEMLSHLIRPIFDTDPDKNLCKSWLKLWKVPFLWMTPAQIFNFFKILRKCDPKTMDFSEPFHLTILDWLTEFWDWECLDLPVWEYLSYNEFIPIRNEFILIWNDFIPHWNEFILGLNEFFENWEPRLVEENQII